MATTNKPEPVAYTAEELIEEIVERGHDVAHHTAVEMRLEFERAAVKRQAIDRLLAFTNPETGKEYSSTAAEKAVDSDAAYALHLASQRIAVAETIIAKAKYEAARLRAQLAVELRQFTEVT